MAARKLIISLFVFAALAHSLTILEPIRTTISDGGELDLGSMGPGQTLAISIDGRPTTGGLYGNGGAYDLANATQIPPGWSAQASDWTGNPLQVKITSEKSAAEGSYSAKISVLDDGDKEKLGNVSFYARISITHDVLDVSLDKNQTTVLSGQPARFYITITNKGSAGDVFAVTSEGVRGWEFKRDVYVPPKSSKTIFYEFISEEGKQYSPVIKVTSRSSELITKSMNATVNVRSDLFTDFKATNNGMLFFPVMNGLIYSLAGLISNLF